MLPGRFSLSLYRGDTASWRFVLWSDRAGTVPVSLTGAVVLAEIRSQPGGALLTTAATGIEAPNVILMSLSSAQTHNLPAKASWDLQITFIDGTVLTPLAGGVSVETDVSASVAAPAADPGDFVPIPLPQAGPPPHP
jgi:hypothetical protein